MRKLLTVRGASVFLLIAATAVLAGCSAHPASESTIEAADVEYLNLEAEAIARQLGISDPPKVEIERVITIMEWGSTQIACLQEAGFPVKPTADGEGIDFQSVADPSIADSLAVARYVCEVRYPVDPKFMKPLTVDQLESLYEYRAGELLGCLADKGYLYAGVPPTKAVFVESDGDWTPYASLSISDADIEEVTRDCPQADMAALYG